MQNLIKCFEKTGDSVSELSSYHSEALADSYGGTTLEGEPSNLYPEIILKYFSAFLFATVIEDLLTELYILENTHFNHKIQKTIFIMKSLEEIKFGVNKLTNNIQGNFQYPLESPGNKLIMLEVIGIKIKMFFEGLYKELTLYRKIPWSAKSEIVKMEKGRWHLKQLEETKEMIKNNYNDLRKQLITQRNLHKATTYNMISKLNVLYKDMENVKFKNAYNVSFANKWKMARQEQLDSALKETSSSYENQIITYRLKTNDEIRAHAEVENINRIIMEDKLKEIEELMMKYESDIEVINLKIVIKKNDYCDCFEKRTMLEQRYEIRKKKLNAWKQYKEAKEKERLYEELMNRNAVIIQAWWRGLLVRLELGKKPRKHRRRRKSRSKTVRT